MITIEYSTTGAAKEALAALFCTSFAASEGVEEGRVIAAFVQDLVETTDPQDLLIVTAHQGFALVGALCFSRYRYEYSDIEAFILSPAAVSPHCQGQGVGQCMIKRGHQALAQRNCEIVITYGDPAFYEKSGFEVIGTEILPAPYPLRYPQAWQVKRLTERELKPIGGKASCVPALRNPELW